MPPAARHGLTYPATRVQARRTCALCVLLNGAGEEEFTRWVKARAKEFGWKGVHLRYSQGVMESLHTKWQDGYSEAYGMPDWRFWHEQRGEGFDVELKGANGHLSKDQKRELPSLRKGGYTVFEWYPRDHHQIERIFREGLAAA